MNTKDGDVSMDLKVKANLQEVLDKMAKAVAFTAQEKEAALARINHMREANRQRFGEMNIAVELVRQGRDRS